jgi:hypothetical protein
MHKHIVKHIVIQGFIVAGPYMERDTWLSGYSSSASASAVRLEGDQFTGLRPR